MIRIKTLGTTLLWVFASLALSATAAQAAEFHSENAKTYIYGEQEGENVFTTTAGNIKCNIATFDSLTAQVAEAGGGSDWTSKMAAVQPQYSGCKAFGQSATVDNPPKEAGTACDYYLAADLGKVTLTGTPLPATAIFEGDTACAIKVTVPSSNCNVIINAQSPTTPSVTFSDTMFAGKRAIKLASGVSGITYTVEGAKGSICGEPGVHTDGKYSGNVVLRGYRSGSHVEAEQIGISMEPIPPAESPEFHSELEKTYIYGEQEGENVFKTAAGNVKCKNATFDSLTAQLAEGGSGSNWTSKMAAVQPQYSSCTAFGQTATIDNPPKETGSACDYELFADKNQGTITGTPLPETEKADTACELKITVPSGACNVVVNQQSPTTPTVTFTNTTFAGRNAIKATSGVKGISYTVEGAKGSICGEPGTFTNGEYTGSIVLRGYKSAAHSEVEQVNISWETIPSGENSEFHSEIEKTFIFGEQEGENIFKTTAGNVKCKSATFDSLSAQAAEIGGGSNWKTRMIAVQPQYSTCTAFGQSATVDNPPKETGSGCDDELFADKGQVTVTGTPLPETGKPAGSCELKITVPSGACNVVVNQQSPTTPTVTFTNTTFAGRNAIKATSGVKGISYTVEGAKGSICGEPGSYTNGEYTGAVVLRGYKSGTHTEAEQVGIEYK